MIADLLRLASIGHNMDLYASLRLRQQHPSNNNSNSNSSTLSPSSIDAPVGQAHKHQKHKAHPQVQQCGPLDLSLKKSLASEARKLRQLEALQRLKLQSELQVKLQVSSSTSSSSSSSSSSSLSSSSASSCSRPASSVSSLDGGVKPEVIQISSSSGQSSQRPASGAPKSLSSQTRRQKAKALRSHLCQQCGRTFSRSDMLTRHSRLHSGLKPYQCGKCKQVFSRSDHLSTHERTHTGEKPYQCQHCAYSACRRDMITRHMRTHSGQQQAAKKLRPDIPPSGMAGETERQDYLSVCE